MDKNTDLIPLVDKSNYLKALLILAKRDKKLPETEKNFIRTIADNLGFSKDFYEDALKNLLWNKNIKETPVVFSSIDIAESFLKDGFKLSMKDSDVSADEQNYLIEIAKANNIPNERFYQIMKQTDLS